MNLTHQLRELIAAAFAGIWVVTQEPDEAQREIHKLCTHHQWVVSSWDLVRGVAHVGNGVGDPTAPLKPHASDLPKEDEVTRVVVLLNYHRFLNNAAVVQELANAILNGKQNRCFFVILSPVVQLPVELEKLFVVVEHALPSAADLYEIHDGLLGEETHVEQPGRTAAVAAAAGLTRYEAEGAFALSIARHSTIEPQTVWELKSQMLRKTGVLELHQGQQDFKDLGGLVALKDFCRRALAPNRPVQAKGVLLLGVPGTGKSAFAKALGVEVGRPTLTFDVGAVYGSLVGESEQRLRQALKIADAMAPCILFIDEVEKSLAGVGGAGDSGVSSRLFGSLLTWLNDHESDVFVICTANDVSKLPPEFTRAERLDAVFFLDLPGYSEQEDIWRQYLRHFGLRKEAEVPNVPVSTGWTGAEIKACCRLSALLGIPLTEAAEQIVPVAVTAADKVAALRTWADGRCLSASDPGVFRQAKSNSASNTRRRVQKQPPSAN